MLLRGWSNAATGSCEPRCIGEVSQGAEEGGASFDPHVGHEEREVLLGEVKVGGQAAPSARPEEVEAHRPPRGRRTTTTAAAATAAATTTFFQLLLKVFIVARVIFKRLNQGAAEDGAEDVLVVRRHLPAAEPTQRLPLGDT